MKSKRVLFRLLVLAAAIWFALTGGALVPAAHAAGVWYVANSGSDGNDCATTATPCASINAALNKPGFVPGDTVRVAIGTYTGSGTEVVLLDKDATISGGWNAGFTSQSGMSTVDGQGARKVVVEAEGTVATMDRFTIQNGYDDGGAGLLSQGTLTLTRSRVTGNSTLFIGGFGNGYGGGIMNMGTLTILESAVTNNIAYGGGGIADYGTLFLVNSTVSANHGYFGGGIVANSTSSRIYINSSTISKNDATTGGGIASNVAETVFFLKDSILAGNHTPNDYNPNCHVGTTSLGYSLTADCYLNGPGDLVDLDPKLGNLDGLPPYHPLLPTSPAIDAGDPNGCTDHFGNPLSTDQRGFPRVGRCDIGAFEAQPIDSSTKVVNKPVASPGDLVSYMLNVRNPDATSLPNVFVTDTLPLQMTFINSSLSATSGTFVYSNGAITWNGPVLANNAVSISYDALVNSSAPVGNPLSNSAVINGGGEIFTRTAATNIVSHFESASLSVDKTYTNPGDSLRFAISFSLSSLVEPTSVLVTDTLPVYLSYNPNSITASSGNPSYTNGAIKWNGVVNPGGTITITFGANVSPTAPRGWSSIVNSAVIKGGGEIISRTASASILYLTYLPMLLNNGHGSS